MSVNSKVTIQRGANRPRSHDQIAAKARLQAYAIVAADVFTMADTARQFENAVMGTVEALGPIPRRGMGVGIAPSDAPVSGRREWFLEFRDRVRTFCCISPPSPALPCRSLPRSAAGKNLSRLAG